ncbi:hypothetical protein [Sphingorhabdus sp. EL138]|uniref:hypothetical protein n=1 Tax=Sphingorhabdus sp. EL138 TaxID=2073156 RepID=UPI000D68ACAA|nr:hypothetical protein [Sphingorhabdus sp. EL138]
MPGYISWRNFWIFWLGGFALFLVLVATGGPLITDVAPAGILDHQSAATAERVDAIQLSWAEAGKMSYAKWSMIGDLVFIGLYSIGGILGGRLIWQEAKSPSLKKLGLFMVLIYFLFGLFDYVETLSQITQLLQEKGSDTLAGIAALARPIKIATWIIGTIGMIIALIWRRRERRA